ncbi:hypothetical protein SCORR_v1c01680 [Spiroplasma corruscae]|uniref:Uncharacterized protein n=1 Tax=Spiroplasma corruscae TaxID=216934 RepID=A0A222ENS8_9MOLU|nr:hypothetical protein [Spiroplasma corruscae]ASP27943.1 hypothetical protein SCORR_v1c01680 [Spiroplasma corruscae]
MKKLLAICLTTLGLTGSTTPFVSSYKNKVFKDEKLPQITKQQKLDMNLDFNMLNLDDLEFIKVGAIWKAEVESDELDKNFKDVELKKLFDILDKYDTNDFKINSVLTNFKNNRKNLDTKNTDRLNTVFTSLNKKLDKITSLKHKIIIEKHNNNIYGTQYYINVLLDITYKDDNDGEKEENNIRIYGIESYKPFTNLNDIKSILVNTFDLTIYYVASIKHKDTEFSSNIIFTSNIVGIILKQYKNTIDEQRFQYQILKYIKTICDVESLSSLDKLGGENIELETIFDYVETPDGKFDVGDAFTDNNAGINRDYFYAKITSKSQVQGEFYILLKNDAK